MLEWSLGFLASALTRKNGDCELVSCLASRVVVSCRHEAMDVMSP